MFGPRALHQVPSKGLIFSYLIIAIIRKNIFARLMIAIFLNVG